jgi:ubiquinone/menaquinone biosynthesis C-methylase UbiE
MRKDFFSDRVREIAIAVADVRPGLVAADIGSGTGFISEALIQYGVKVIAVDQSKAMLEEMKKRFKRFDNVEYRLGQFNSLPMQNETVDCVFANMYLHHVDLPQVAIDEMVRVLKPGGKVVITDLDEHDFEFLRNEQHDRWLGFKREDVKRWFKWAGLKNVSVDCVGDECCAASTQGDGKARISIFVAYGEKR